MNYFNEIKTPYITFPKSIQPNTGFMEKPQAQPQLITQPQQQLPQVPDEQQQQAGFLSNIGKAFSNFSKALATPGFGEVFFGNIAQALGGQDTWQGRLGGVLGQLGAARGQGNVSKKLQAGQPTSQWENMFITPEMRLEQQKADVYGGLAGAQAGTMQPWQSKAVQDIMSDLEKNATDIEREKIQALSKLLNPPTMQNAPVGEGIEAAVYPQFNQETGQYEWKEYGKGRTKGFENTTLSPTANLAIQKFGWDVYKQARKEAFEDPRTSKYGKIRVNPNTGEYSIDWIDPQNGPAEFNRILDEKLKRFVENPSVGLSSDYLNMNPPQPLSMEWE